MPTMIRIAQALVDQMWQHALRTFPEECCGILLGQQRDRDCEVQRIVEADNIAEGDRRRSYQVSWRALLSTVRAARIGKGEIVGFYHSHPDGSVHASEEDRKAAWIDFVYVILPVSEGTCRKISCWRVRNDGSPFEREEVHVA